LLNYLTIKYFSFISSQSKTRLGFFQRGSLMISIFKRGVAIALLCSVAASHAQSSVKVGMVLPLSGPLAGTGNDIAQGARAAVDAFNQAGGLKGQKIELLIEDDRFDAKLSEELARDLIEKKALCHSCRALER
jgi:ABC-type branched-subunit amino acid transport system substrate-binding protein